MRQKFESLAETTKEAMKWKQQAACREAPWQYFFPGLYANGTEAKSICRNCPVRLDCLEYAPDDKDLEGI